METSLIKRVDQFGADLVQARKQLHRYSKAVSKLGTNKEKER